MAKNEIVSLALIYNRPMHVYAINTIIKEVELDKWATISPVSIYNMLMRFEKQGLVKVSTEKVGNMPERKVYSITGEGRKRLKTEIRDAILCIDEYDISFYVAATLCFGLKPDEIIEYLQQRVTLFENLNKEMRQKIKHLQEFQVKNAVIMYHSAIKHHKVEIELAKELIKMVEEDPEFYPTLSQMLYSIYENKGGKEN